jgi:hypothetical protein
MPFKVKNLHFDHKNPRLAEYGIEEKTPEPEILKILWDAMDVQELVQSIAASGFFPHEALIVTKEHGKNIVIEGNRRLAAVKVLLHDRVARDNNWEVPTLTPVARSQLEELPAIVSDRKDSWRYLGFKHVNGPAKWSSYAKAAYIAEVHRLYKVPLSDIADQIGDRHAGLFMDRCRIVDYCANLDPELTKRVKAWCTAAKKTVVLAKKLNKKKQVPRRLTPALGRRKNVPRKLR